MSKLPVLGEREIRMLQKLQTRRMDLRALLSDAERRTRRTWGSEEPETWEDRARERAGTDPEVGLGLSRFQETLGEVWVRLGRELGLNASVLALYRAKKRDRRDGQELMAEAEWALRGALLRLDLSRPRSTEALVNWLVLEMLEAMGIRRAQLDSPVELPQRIAKKVSSQNQMNNSLHDHIEKTMSNEEDA